MSALRLQGYARYISRDDDGDEEAFTYFMKKGDEDNGDFIELLDWGNVDSDELLQIIDSHYENWNWHSEFDIVQQVYYACPDDKSRWVIMASFFDDYDGEEYPWSETLKDISDTEPIPTSILSGLSQENSISTTPITSTRLSS